MINREIFADLSHEKEIDNRIWLSPPHMSGKEMEYVQESFESNWISPVGLNINGFENDLEDYLSNKSEVIVLNSGTAALHMALVLLGVSKGDYVICQSFTFCASANPIVYLGATPVFVDSETDTWNMSPELLEQAIEETINKDNKKPKAIIAVSLYGMPYKSDEINSISRKYGIPVVEDSAEALGSSYLGKKCGLLGDVGVFSFNGNKIITTSTGGALVLNNRIPKSRALHLASQARDKNEKAYYEHTSIGYNYIMSNVLAGIGRGQIRVLDRRVEKRRENFEYYKDNLSQSGEITFMDEPEGFYSNRWLTCILLESNEIKEKIRLTLANNNIDSRPLWKPMHMQPIYKDALKIIDGTCERLFDRGLCLPSGSNLEKRDMDRIIDIIKGTFR